MSDSWKEFAEDFITLRKDALAHSDLETFMWQYMFLFDRILAPSPKFKMFSKEEMEEFREHFKKETEVYFLKHMSQA